MEYALTLPLLLLTLIGLIDTAQLVLLYSQMDHVVREAGNLTSRGDQVDEAWTTILAGQSALDLSARGQLIFTTIGRCGGVNCITSQSTRGARTHITSSVGAVGDTPVLPRPITLSAGETLTVVEAAYDFTPLINAPAILGFSFPAFVQRSSYF
jgi:Flp pilus assembly protein TadG